MRQRHIRLAASDTAVRFQNHSGEVVNLSLSGALLDLDGPVDLATQSPILLRKGTEAVELIARVVRQTGPGQYHHLVTRGTNWLVAVEFVDVSPDARKAIPRLLRPAVRR